MSLATTKSRTVPLHDLTKTHKHKENLAFIRAEQLKRLLAKLHQQPLLVELCQLHLQLDLGDLLGNQPASRHVLA